MSKNRTYRQLRAESALVALWSDNLKQRYQKNFITQDELNKKLDAF